MRASRLTTQTQRIGRASLAAGFAGLGFLLLAFAAPSRPEPPAPPDPPVTPEQAAFFETKIRPILANDCQSCHGKDAALGGLRVDSRAALRKGGASGGEIVPGDPDHSRLIAAVRQTGALKMPQGGDRLKPAEIAALEAWVKMGAPWPEAKAASASGAAAAANAAEAWRSFWSLRPVTMPPIPRVKNTGWVRTPVDAFILARLEAKGLSPAPPADRRTLLRRVTFDLTGLPPTQSEAAAFVADRSPDAYEKVVDRLLASPRYGECWARHWLDVARYADTKGYVFNEDRNYPNAYTYRTWVIDAFNRDLPFDRFVTYQLAADLAPEVKNGTDKRPLAALGFLTVGRRFLNSQPDIMDDRIDVTMRGFEGMTVACARCHDHKFDPIPTADYYSLYGVFANAPETAEPISPPAISRPWEAHNAEIKAAEDARDALIRDETKRLRGVVMAAAPGAAPGAADTLPEPVRKALQSVREGALPEGETLKTLETAFTPDATAKLAALRGQLDTLAKNAPPMPEFAMAVTDRAKPEEQRIFRRGSPNNPGDVVPRRLPLCLTPANAPRTEWTDGSGRLDLARALTAPSNPRTSRVFANRVWLYHFGYGLVRTPSDFGRQGERPSHPELLDYLAARFMRDGWSVKRLQRLIVLSNAYRQSSEASAKALQMDPENRLVAHQNRRRLDLEQMHDALLMASGKLDTSTVGGRSVDLWKAPFPDRRAVYGFIERQNLPGTFRTFDFATPDATSAQRFHTTIPQQALFLMNSPFAIQQATALASLAVQQPTAAAPTGGAAAETARDIRRLYLRLFDRLPDADEVAAGLAYLSAPDPPGNAGEELSPPAPAWQYGWGGYDTGTGRVRGFTAFPKYDPARGMRYAGDPYPAADALGYAALRAQGGHPGRDAAHAVIRRWVAPRALTVDVTGLLRHPSDQGDGVHARLVSSRLGSLGEWTAQHGDARTDVAGIAVQRGDTLDFIVDDRASDAFDSFEWAPVVRAAAAAAAGSPPAGRHRVVVWDAERGFSEAPMAKKVKPLTKWERYAQALLMTNEFVFVD